MDDYGHHPTEIKATLAAVRDVWKGRVIVAFQPHRYTRTKALLDQFVTSFNEADMLIVTEIYAASEEKIEGITGSALAERIAKSGHKNVLFAPTKEALADTILQNASPGDLVITLGAGDIYKVGERLIEVWSGKG
jgi:UDP-N-acetylmuramate--alanine ligase